MCGGEPWAWALLTAGIIGVFGIWAAVEWVLEQRRMHKVHDQILSGTYTAEEYEDE